MKIVWLCPLESSVYKEYLSNNSRNQVVAPWMTELINDIANIDAVQLSVISYSSKIKKSISFTKKNVTYHILKIGVPFLTKGYSYYKKIDQLTGYFFLHKKIESIVDTINPDIIHLHGTEHPYSKVIVKYKEAPHLVSFLGIVHSHAEFYNDSDTIYKLRVEEDILKNCSNFSTRAKYMNNFILKHNPSANLYCHDYPINQDIFSIDTYVSKNVDLVFFARVVKVKGIEDLIKACRVVKKKFEHFTLNVIGPISNSYKEILGELILSFGLEKNIKIIGYIKNRENLYKEILKSKISVLPTYHDVGAGTVCECMILGIPVIAYNVGGIPDLLENGKNGVLVEPHNIVQLAEEIINLLNNDELQTKYAKNAKQYAYNRFRNPQIGSKLISIYQKIIDNKDINNFEPRYSKK